MYRKILISGATAAAIIGAGGTALAVSGSDTTSGAPASSTSTSSTAQPGAKAGKHKGAKAGKQKGGEGRLLKHLAHAQVVTKGKDGSFVTHDLITGTVTSVSSTSITVQAADKTSETFSVSKTTVVRQRTAGDPKTKTKAKGAASSISKIAKGDHVVVAGTGTSHFAAKRIVELAK